MSQYGYRSLTLDPPQIVYSPNAPAPTYSDEDVFSLVWSMIGNTTYPDPDDEKRIFMVFTPAGTLYSTLSASGAHNEEDHPNLFSPDIIWVLSRGPAGVEMRRV